MNNVFHYDSTGKITGMGVAVKNPDDETKLMVPDNSTMIAPPMPKLGEVPYFDKNKQAWELRIDWSYNGNTCPLFDKKTLSTVYIEQPGITPNDIGATTHNPFEDIQMNGDNVTLITKGVHWSDKEEKFVINPHATDMFKYDVVTGEAVHISSVDTDMTGFTRSKPYAIRYMSYDAASDTWKNDREKETSYLKTVIQECRDHINASWKAFVYTNLKFEGKYYSVSKESRDTITGVQNYLAATGLLPVSIKETGWKANDNTYVPMDEAKWGEFYKALVEWDLTNFKTVNEIKAELSAINIEISEQNPFETILTNIRNFKYSLDGENFNTI